MKQKFYTSGLVFLIILSICIFTGCNGGKEGKEGKSIKNMAAWPADLPKFEYGKVHTIQLDENSGEFFGAVFSNIKNPETAYNNYKTTLNNNGWVLDYESTNEFGWVENYIKGTGNVNVNIQKDGSVAQIMYLAR